MPQPPDARSQFTYLAPRSARVASRLISSCIKYTVSGGERLRRLVAMAAQAPGATPYIFKASMDTYASLEVSWHGKRTK